MTVRALAEELSVSKTTVQRTIDKLFPSEELRKVGNRIELSSEQIAAIKEEITHCGDLQETPQTPQNLQQSTLELLQSELSFLREQIKAKDEQIAADKSTISDLTAALNTAAERLNAEQILHARTQEQCNLLIEMKTPFLQRVKSKFGKKKDNQGSE